MSLREDALKIVDRAIEQVLPEPAVEEVLRGRSYAGRVVVVAVGKAAWRMAAAASRLLGEQISRGVVVTKYHHSQGELPRFQIVEAAHPVPDENSLRGAQLALAAVEGLGEGDQVIFLLSGGGSALFEQLAQGVSLGELQHVTDQLLGCGADIVEVNTIRKRLSLVKGGRFAQRCAPAQVLAVVLSDVVGDRLDTIASGPACPDGSTSAQALEIVEKYKLDLSPAALAALEQETPKALERVETVFAGNLDTLRKAAAQAARDLGYATAVWDDPVEWEAAQAGQKLAAKARQMAEQAAPQALIAGGETVVRLGRNPGKGGRNQETALAAALELEGTDGMLVLSVGSDGTDGPTDAAGGFAQGDTAQRMRQAGLDPADALAHHNAYPALEAAQGLVVTGPTGTNVNDLLLVLTSGAGGRT